MKRITEAHLPKNYKYNDRRYTIYDTDNKRFAFALALVITLICIFLMLVQANRCLQIKAKTDAFDRIQITNYQVWNVKPYMATAIIKVEEAK